MLKGKRFTINNYVRIAAFIFTMAFCFVGLNASAVTKTSNGTGSWNTSARWSPSGAPNVGDDVIIALGSSITIDVSTNSLASLTVNGTLTFNSSTDRTLFVSGMMTISSTGIVTVANATATNNHTISLQGNLSVAGTLNLIANIGNNDFCNMNFNGNNALQTVTGAGTKSFNTISVNKGTSQSNIVDVQSVMTMTDGGLTITNGTFKLSAAATITPFTANTTIPATGGIWNNGGTINSTGGNITATGLVKNSLGTFNLGNANNNSLNAASATSSIIVDGGNLTVAGRIQCTNGNYSQSNGTVTVSNSGNTSSSIASFDLNTPANFTMSAGTIILKNISSGYDYLNTPAVVNITGGTVQAGSATSSGSIYYVGGYFPSMEIYNAKFIWLAFDAVIKGNLTINTSAELDCYDPFVVEGYTAYVTGNVVNNGLIDGITGFTTLSEFSFNGNSAQAYSGTGNFGTTTFPFEGWGLTLDNPTTVTFNAASPQLVTLRANLFQGSFINSNKITLGNAAATYAVVQRGGIVATNAGTFDVAPTFNVGTGGLYLIYGTANSLATGYEIPTASRTAYYFSNSNPNTVTLAGGNLDITTDVVLTAGTFDLDANTLRIGGVLSRTSGNMDGSDGTLEMNNSAATAQSIPASSFVGNNLKNLIISNNNNVTGVSLNGALDIYRSVTFGASGLKLTTGDFLTFKSTSTETAWLGNMTGKTISGAATVERYIPNHAKAWQFLSTPTFGQTVNASWQECNAPLGNTVPNHGTIITSTFAGAGFDIVSGNNPSMKTYDSTTKTWVGIANTSISIANQKGYMLFVRGDRSVQNTSTPATYTTLRTKGTLYTPANPPSVTNLAANTFQSLGNPYASAIDLTLLSRTGGVQDVYYVWDPKLTIGSYSPYGLGGYQTFVRNGSTYDVIPGGGSYPTEICKTIESGQAFFVRAPLAIGTVSFTEACKATGSNLVTRAPMAPITTRFKQLRTNLRVITAGESILIDGNRVQYNESWSNNIDIEDAVKIGNTGENLGIARNGNTLAVERRSSLQKTDTIFYKLGQLRVQQYEFEFIPTDIVQPGMTAYLEDKYLHTSTVVSLQDTSRVRFNIVNIPGSYAADRFMLVFRKKTVGIPVINVNADTRRNNGVEAVEGTSPEKMIPGITVYPNPVVNKMMQVQFSKQSPGNYSIQLTSSMGQVVYNGSIKLSNGDMIKPVRLNESIAAGTYQLTVVSETGSKTTQQIIIQ